MIELLMVLGIISVLLALLLPGLSSARESTRRVTCLNNMRQIALAAIQVSSQKNRLPASGYFSASGPEQYRSWVVDLLPDLDHQDVYNQWNQDFPSDNADSSSNASLAKIHLPILCCPSDTSVVSGEGNLSYVTNGGHGWTVPTDCPVIRHWTGPGPSTQIMLDLNGDGKSCDSNATSDRLIYQKTGLFFIENWPVGSGTSRFHTLNSITDGLSTTIMFSENVRAGYDPTLKSNWATAFPTRNSFFVSGFVCVEGRCSEGNVDYGRANDPGREPYSSESINASLSAAEGEAPWPSSEHRGGVNIANCDGSARFLSGKVSGSIYAALVSPQGLSLRGPLAQTALDLVEY